MPEGITNPMRISPIPASDGLPKHKPTGISRIVLGGCLAALLSAVPIGCGTSKATVADSPKAENVGVTRVVRKTLERKLTVSSELVPFQEVDVYAKEPGYVKDLLVDYGSRVKKGQLMALLEIPELQVQLRQDDAAVGNASDLVMPPSTNWGEWKHNSASTICNSTG